MEGKLNFISHLFAVLFLIQCDNKTNYFINHDGNYISIGRYDDKGYKQEVWKYIDKIDSFLVYKLYYINDSTRGPYTKYYRNGVIREKGFYLPDRVKDDTLKKFYSNGTLKQINVYDKGTLNGIKKIFYSSGQLKLKANYIKGKVDGYVMQYSENDSLIAKILFNNGIYQKGIHFNYGLDSVMEFNSYNNGKNVKFYSEDSVLFKIMDPLDADYIAFEIIDNDYSQIKASSEDISFLSKEDSAYIELHFPGWIQKWSDSIQSLYSEDSANY